MADYDHHGNEIPVQKHSRADIQRMMLRQAAPASDQRRTHPREYEPTWEFGDYPLSLEEQVGFDLESVHRMRRDPR